MQRYHKHMNFKKIGTLVTGICKKYPLRAVYVAGVFYYGYKISWLRGIRSSDLTEGWLATIIGFTPYLIAVITFSFVPVIFVLLFTRLKIRFTQILFIWLTPLVWILSESIVSVLFSIVSLGIGGRIGDYWHFGNVGLAGVHTPLIYASRWGGLYLLSFCVVMLVCSLLYTVLNRRLLPLAVVATSIFMLSFSGYYVYRSPTGKSSVMTAIGSRVLADNEYVNNPLPDVVATIPSSSSDVVVLPEYSRFWEYNTKQNSAELARVLKNPKGLVIDSDLKSEINRRYNVISYSNSSGNPYSQQYKWFTVPGGEFVPYIFRGPLRLFGQSQSVRTFESTRSISPAKSKEKPFAWNGVSYGVLACSAANAPELYRSITNSGAEVLVNTASLGTVGLSSTYHDESFAQSKLQAVANARPFVQSARGGYNFILDSSGRTIMMDTSFGDSYIQATVTSNKTKTMYTYFGNWTVYIAMLIVGFLLLKKSATVDRLYKKRLKRFNYKHYIQRK